MWYWSLVVWALVFFLAEAMERTLMYSGIDGRAYVRPEQLPGERLRALRGLGRFRLLLITLALTGAAAALLSPGPIRPAFESLTARYGKGPTYGAPFALTLLVLLAAFALRFAARRMVHHAIGTLGLRRCTGRLAGPYACLLFFIKKKTKLLERRIRRLATRRNHGNNASSRIFCALAT